MTDNDVITALKRIADASQDAAERGAELADRYASLRQTAERLNDRHEWATPDDFDTQLPTLDALVQIESLDGAFEASPAAESRGFADRLTDALLQLAGWATGVRLAQETLREIDRDLGG